MLAVVIGGASGIGASVVARQRDRGVEVVVWDVAEGADVTCDVTDADAVDRAVADTDERSGLPDQVSITVGVGHGGLLADVTPDDWDRVLGINAKGVWLAMRAWAKAWTDAGRGGSIVVTSSISARLADRDMGLYCASKAALDMVVRVAAQEWAPQGIRVNAVAPGVTRTPMLGHAPPGAPWWAPVEARTPLGRLGEADEVAEAIVALHGLGWVTGQILVADGGLSQHSPIDTFGTMATLRAQPR